MNYTTASPTPTSVSGQGNTPVSFASSRCTFLIGRPQNLYHSSQSYRKSNLTTNILYAMMATLTDHENGNLQPVCQNCSTSTTPLWRRDEIGSVLCNACGLFLKLHGRNRPLALKTDVIKSRNRVKSAGQGQKKKVSSVRSIAIRITGLLNARSLSSIATDIQRHGRKLAAHHPVIVEYRTKALRASRTVPTLQSLVLERHLCSIHPTLLHSTCSIMPPSRITYSITLLLYRRCT